MLKTRPIRARSLVVYATDEPKNPALDLGPHHRYRHPRLEMEERELPPLAIGMIRVQMAGVGICGTDLHLLETKEDGYTRCSSPANIPPTGRVLGHEGVGIIAAIGEAVEGFKEGDVVCFESIVTCRSCEKCRQGAFNQCLRSRLLGMEQDGLFAGYANVPASLAHGVNDMAKTDRDYAGLACVEPAAVAYLACINARITPGETVAVFGAGPIGFYAALLAKTLFGASHVSLVEPTKFRREFGRNASDQTLTPAEFSEEGRTFDVLIDAAGDLRDVSAAIARMNGNGRIVLLSRSGEPLYIDLVDQIISKNLHLIGSRGHLGGAFNAVLSLARKGRLDLHAPVTKVVHGLESLAELLQNPARLLANDCKVVARLN